MKTCPCCESRMTCTSSVTTSAMRKAHRRIDLLLLLAVLFLGPPTSATSEALTSSSSSNFKARSSTAREVHTNGIETTRNGFHNPGNNTVNGFHSPEHTAVNGFRSHPFLNGKGKHNGVNKVNGQHDDDPVVPAEYIAETKLPTDVGHFKLRAYRMPRVNGNKDNSLIGDEPCVIYHAEKAPFGKSGKLAHNVPVRIHDQCLTSEVFGSRRCDCKEQLLLALQYVKEHGGAIIYMPQEGRGIGLANKVAAYQLQDLGMDTVDANLHLGFPEDARKYGCVPSILQDMDIGSIQLLTNNPWKVERLTALGVDVKGTVPVLVPNANPYNRKYLETKHERMDHTNLAEVLASPLAFVPKANGYNKRNGSMRPRKLLKVENLVKPVGGGMPDLSPVVPPNGVVNGDSVEVSLVVEGNKDETCHDDVNNDVNGMEGVVAASDGYCFGRKSVEAAIAAVARGEIVVVVDDMDRENEGDLIMAADKCTDLDMARIVRYSSGVVCVGMEGQRMDELNLPSMVARNEDPKGTAFSITVDATKKHGITTGISATDRAKTVRLLSDPRSKAIDFNRPGHLFPLRARDGGVLSRDGHTEAAVDLSRLAGLNPCGVLCEIVSEENPTEMMKLPELKRFAKRHGFALTSIADLAQYRRDMNM